MRLSAALLALPLVTLAGPGLFGQVPVLVVTGCACLAICGLAWKEDPWLSLLAGYGVLRSFWPGAAWDVGILLAVGVLLILAARELPARFLPALHAMVGTLVCIQVGFGIVQTVGYDPLWLWDQQMPSGATVHGILGNSNYLGAFLAMAAGFLAWPLLLVAGVGILLSKSLLAGVAFAAAVMLRYRMAFWWTAPSCGVALVGLLLLRGGSVESWWYRLSIWGAGLGHWFSTTTSALVGWGPGAWERMGLVAQRPGTVSREWFKEAHNDYLQFGYEYGLIGLLLLAGWLTTWGPTITRSRYAPSVLALAIVAAAMFPFHLSPTAVLGATILGVATRTEGDW